MVRSEMSQIVAMQQVRLLNAFHQGKITEEYLNRRMQQFEDERADEPLPTMFEADRPLSKERYLREHFADDYDTILPNDRDLIYSRYLERIKDQKHTFLLKKYFEAGDYCYEVEQRTREEKIALENAWEQHKQRMAALEQAQNHDDNVIIDNMDHHIVDNGPVVDDVAEPIIINEEHEPEKEPEGRDAIHEIEQNPEPEKKPEKPELHEHGLLDDMLEEEELIDQNIINNIVDHDNENNNIINNIVGEPQVANPEPEVDLKAIAVEFRKGLIAEKTDDAFDELKYIRQQGKKASDIYESFWAKSIEALKKSGTAEMPLDRATIVREMQKAALEFRGADKGVVDDSPENAMLDALANNGSDYVRAKLLEDISAGKIQDLDADTVNGWDLGEAVRPTETYYDFYLRNHGKETGYGSEIREKDAELDYELNKIVSAMRPWKERYDKLDNKTGSNLEDVVKNYQAQLDELKNQRIPQLKEELKEGKITRWYYDARMKQFENDEYDKAVPYMFEADNIVSYATFTRNNKQYDALSAKEKRAIYNDYVKRIKQERKDYFIRMYLDGIQFVKVPEKVVEKPVNEIIDEQPKVEEVKPEEIKVEQPKVEEVKPEEIKVEQPKVKEVKPEEVKPEQPKVEEVKPEEPKVEEVKPEEPQNIINEEPEVQYGENKIINDLIYRAEPEVDFDDLPEEQMPGDYHRLDPMAQMSDLFVIDNSILDRYFICKTPDEVGLGDDFDEIKYLQISHESPKEFNDRVWKTAVEAFKQASSEATSKGMSPTLVANALHSAAAKYLAVHPNLDPNAEGVVELYRYAFEGPESYIREKVKDEAANGLIPGLSGETVNSWNRMDLSSRIKEPIGVYAAENWKDGFSIKVLQEEAEFNRKMLGRLERIEYCRQKAEATDRDAEKQIWQRDIESEKKAIDKDVLYHKRGMVNYLRSYAIGDKFFEDRVKQLDARDFVSPIPALFEADAPLSKQDYIAAKGLDETKAEETDKAYRTYLRTITREKQALMARYYLRMNGMMGPREVKIKFNDPIAEEIEAQHRIEFAEQKAYEEQQARLRQEKEKEVERKKPVKIGVRDIDELYGNVDMLDRFFLAKSASDVNPDPDLDEIKWIKESNVNPGTFAYRLINEGVRVSLHADDEKRAQIAAAVQLAAVKFLSVRPDAKNEEDAYDLLKQIVQDAPKVIKDQILTDIKNWDIRDIDAKTASSWDFGVGIKLKTDFETFMKREDILEFGADVIEDDIKFYDTLRRTVKQEDIPTRCAERKAKLAEELKQGKITQYYYDKRAKQLDSNEIIIHDNLPTMFEYDRPDDYADYAQKHGLDIKDFVGTQNAYNQYIADIKAEQAEFFARLYWKEMGIDQPDYLTKRMAAIKAGLDKEEDNKNIINDTEVQKPVEQKPVEQKPAVEQPVEEPKQEVFESEADIARRLKKEQGIEDEELSFAERVKEAERRRAERMQRELEEAQAANNDNESDVDEEDIEPININDLAEDKEMLTRYFLAPKPKFFNADPDLDEAQWIRDNDENVSAFFYRVWKSGLNALKEADLKDSQLKRSDIAAAMQMAAIKYILAAPELDKNDDDYDLLNDLAFKGPEFIKQRILDNIDKGYISDLDKETVESWDLGTSIAPKESFDVYYDREENRYGEDVRDADRDLNDTVEDLLADNRIIRDDEDEEYEDELQDKRKPLSKEEKKARVDALVAERKAQLAEDLKQGRTTKYYYDLRMQQLAQPEKLGSSRVPHLFEEDDRMTWNEYFETEEKAGRTYSEDEKDDVYDAYKARIKQEKESFFKARYVKENGLDAKDYLTRKLGGGTGAQRISVDLNVEDVDNKPVVEEKDKQDVRLSRVSSVEEKDKQDAKSPRPSARRSKPVTVIIDEEQEDELDEIVKAEQAKADAAEDKGKRITVDLTEDASAADQKQFAQVGKDPELKKGNLKK